MPRLARKFTPATDRQISYIVSLAVERGYTFTAEDNTLANAKGDKLFLNQIDKSGASTVIDGLKRQPRKATAVAPRDLASEKQIDFLISLMGERGWDVSDHDATSPQGATVEFAKLPKADASDLITQLKAQPRAQVAKPDPRVKITEDGMYCLDGVIYKVQVNYHGSGKLTVKRLIVESEAIRDGNELIKAASVYYRTESEPAIKFRLSPSDRMSTEQAAKFGDLYGCCVRCGSVLTDQDSINRGMGPICAGQI